jgi:hypothetical protein
MTTQSATREGQATAKTAELDYSRPGSIGVRITETRLAAGGRRFGVVFGRVSGDLALDGDFSVSLGQEELMDLIAAAAEAYRAIEFYRAHPSDRPTNRFDATPFGQRAAADGWENDSEDFFPQQIEDR